MTCAGCGLQATYRRVREPWVYLVDRRQAFCPECDPDPIGDYNGPVVLVFTRGKEIVHAKLVRP